MQAIWAPKSIQTAKELEIRAGGGAYFQAPGTKRYSNLLIHYPKQYVLNEELNRKQRRLYNYPGILSASKTLSWHRDITTMTVTLMSFLKENELLTCEPFNEDGSLKGDFVLYDTGLTATGLWFFNEYYPKWSAYVDRTGNFTGTKTLQNGLAVIKQKEKERRESEARGEARAIRTCALNFLNCGVDPQIIAKSTGLSLDEINKLKDAPCPDQS